MAENWYDIEARQTEARAVRRLTIWVAVFAVLCLVMLVALTAGAQETHREMLQRHGQDPYMAWDYRLPGKPQTSCCNGRDCRPVRSRYNATAHEFELEVAAGVWIMVDRGKVVDQPSFDDRWHWCAPRARPLSPWCLIEPANGV